MGNRKLQRFCNVLKRDSEFSALYPSSIPTGTRFGPWRAQGPKCCDSTRFYNQCDTVLDFPGCVLRDRVSWTLKSFVPVVQHSLLDRRLIGRLSSEDWQQDLSLENGQGTSSVLLQFMFIKFMSRFGLELWKLSDLPAWDAALPVGTKIASNQRPFRFQTQLFDCVNPFLGSQHRAQAHVTEKPKPGQLVVP